MTEFCRVLIARRGVDCRVCRGWRFPKNLAFCGKKSYILRFVLPQEPPPMYPENRPAPRLTRPVTWRPMGAP